MQTVISLPFKRERFQVQDSYTQWRFVIEKWWFWLKNDDFPLKYDDLWSNNYDLWLKNDNLQDLHRPALRWPADRFVFIGIDTLPEADEDETEAHRVRDDLYWNDDFILTKWWFYTNEMMISY